MVKTPHDAVAAADDADPAPGSTTSGEHYKLDAVRCPHCNEAHPPAYSHCPRTGRPLQTGPALVGRVIAGRYRVTGILGEGGMGAVYIAEHLLLGRKVAIKRLHPELAGDEKAVARFQREARAAAATGHEHIVEVMDLGYAEDGAPYLVMEYLRGSALAQVLKQQGRLPVSRTMNIVGQVLAALGAVHQREIVHRDLKPDNVFLTRKGGVVDYVKVLDFGISKMKQEEGEPANLTRTGVTMGTPYYMSPEQARGVRKLDHRVDLYAVAVILYECITGRLPLMGDNYHALLQQILRVDPIPPSTIVPGLPPELDAVMLKGLAKDPNQRYASSADMLAALLPFGARAMDLTAMLSTQPVAPARLEAILDAARVDARAPTESVATSSAPEPSPRPSVAAEAPRTDPRRSALASAPGSLEARPPEAPAVTARPPEPRAPEVRSSRTPGPRASAPRASATGNATTGPRYFFAASEDWNTSERAARTSASGSGGAMVGGAATPAGRSGTGLTRAVGSGAVAERTDPPFPREAAPREAPRSARDEVSVKGALVVGLLDHLETEPGGSAAVLKALEPALRDKLDGVILPMAWLPLPLFESMLQALGDDMDGLRAQAAGRAAAERELSTTHRLFLQTATPTSVLDRLPHLHRLYFSRGEAKVTAVTHGSRIELDGVGEGAPLVAWLAGFWQRMLELGGAREVKVVAFGVHGRGDDKTSVTLRWR